MDYFVEDLLNWNSPEGSETVLRTFGDCLKNVLLALLYILRCYTCSHSGLLSSSGLTGVLGRSYCREKYEVDMVLGTLVCSALSDSGAYDSADQRTPPLMTRKSINVPR